MVMAPNRPLRKALLALLACLPLIATAQQPQQEEMAFIELSASEDEVYVQQQLRLTVKLYYTNDVIQGQLSAPEHPDAVIEQLGEQKQYRELLDGERYRVVEREYVIFPQKPGRLQLPPLDFQGTARHPRGHHYRIADSAVLFAVNVKDIPASFSGSTWLPATDLSLSDSGLDRTGPVKPGDNLTRTLTLTARGLPATTLPSLDIQYPDAIRSYPEPEQRQSSAGARGVIGELQQTVALVPVPGQGGNITLPEVRIPWWDVAEDRERMAVLPARTIQLTLAPGPERAEPSQTAAQPHEEGMATDPEPAATPVARTHWVWPILVGLLMIGWATTAVAWWLQNRRPSPAAAGSGEKSHEKERYHRLREQARKLDPAFFNQFPAWVGELTGQRCRTTDEALRMLSDEHLTGVINHWRASLFQSSGSSGEPVPDGNDLAGALKTARKRWHDGVRGHNRGEALPNLYPEGLSP